MWLNIKSFDDYKETFQESEKDRLAFGNMKLELFLAEKMG